MSGALERGAPVVIIGAGQAGFSAASKLRELGHDGPITLVGDEAEAPYQRPPLSKAYLLGDLGRERLFLRPPGFYAERGLTLRLGMGVAEIRREAQQVVLIDGTVLPYARLLLATGARARRIEAQGLDRVLTMRNLADADRLSQLARTGAHLLVVGGGYVGLEAASSAVKLGMRVTLIEAAERILGRVAAAETADYFRALHLSHGVDLREGLGLGHLVGTGGKVSGAVLGDGSTMPVDLVLAGIGVIPNTALAETAGLAVDNGIRVGADCRTSDPLVFAAGDCASFPCQGRRIRLESVGNAIDQAEVAAANMLGQGCDYIAKPWFWSDQYDTKLQIAGLSQGYDRLVVRGGGGAARSHWYLQGDRLKAVDAINDPRAFMVAKRLLDRGLALDETRLADPAQDLGTLLRDAA